MKLYEKLKLIQKNEWKDFEKFVFSPYFNKGRDYIPLLSLLKKFHPDFESEKLSKENLYKQLYKGKKYNENVMNTILSGLSIICEEFFLYQNFREKDSREIRLLNEYIKRGDETGAAKYSKLVQSGLSRIPRDSMDFFENLDKIDALQLYYAMIYKKGKRCEVLIEGIKNLICFTMLQSFIFKKEILLNDKRYLESDSGSAIADKMMDSVDFEKLLDIIQKEDPVSFPILKIYYLVMKQLSDTENDDYYYEIRDLVSENLNTLEPDTGKRLLLNIMSICNMKSNSGKKEFIKESFQIMKKLVEEKYFDDIHGTVYFPPSHFRNIVKAGIEVKETEWVENFVKDYSPKLEHSQTEPLMNFSLAKISFAKKNFDESLKYLGKVNTDNSIFKLDIKKLTSMIYYETGSFVNLNSLLNAYYQTVKIRNKKNENIFTRHRQFINYLKKLENIRNGSRDCSELHIQKEHLIKDNVSEKNWLMEKYTEAERDLEN